MEALIDASDTPDFAVNRIRLTGGGGLERAPAVHVVTGGAGLIRQDGFSRSLAAVTISSCRRPRGARASPRGGWRSWSACPRPREPGGQVEQEVPVVGAEVAHVAAHAAEGLH